MKPNIMKKLYDRLFLPILLAVVFVTACKEDGDAEPVLSISISSLAIPVEGSKSEITITCNKNWRISNPVQGWLTISQVS
jgi:hypothetical protein